MTTVESIAFLSQTSQSDRQLFDRVRVRRGTAIQRQDLIGSRAEETGNRFHDWAP